MDDCTKSPLSSAWSELPQKIISKIERCLDSALDMSSLRSVCKNWHSSRKPDNVSILSPFLPMIFSNVRLPFAGRQNEPVVLIARAVFLVKPLHDSSASRGWLLTVEEMVPGKLRVLYPLSIDHVEHLPSNHPKYLDLSKFNVTQIAKSYGFNYASDGKDVYGVRRVVMCSASTVMVLYGKGTVIGMKLKNGFWSYVRHSLLSPISDITSYGENHVCAVDSNGNVHIIDHEVTKVVNTMSPRSVDPVSNRITIFESNGVLFAVACDQRDRWSRDLFCNQGDRWSRDLFCIYRLDEEKNEWINVRDTTYCSKVLFISSHWSFFIYTRELDLRYHLPEQKDPKVFDVNLKNSINEDYVIYSDNYLGSLFVRCTSGLYNDGASIDLGISVFFSDSENMSFWKQYFHSITIELLWPPPAWFWTDPHLTSREDEELDGHRQNGAVFQIQITAVENSDAATIQNLNRNSSTTEFKGVNINSNLVSTLQKIWEKYGDLMEQITFRNADIIARALESLATAVIILQSNTGNSLNKDHADYLNSALCDLQQMKFKVDWLVPFVENAIAVQKSKPLIDSMKDFDKAKAVAEEMKQKVFEEVAKLDQVGEDMALVYERLPVLKSMDFNQSLGDGLC